MSKQPFVSGLPGPAPQGPTLTEALKSLEVGVKGYAVPRTDADRRYEAQRYPEREVPTDKYWPIHTEQDMIDKRLANFPLTDTSKAEQIPLPLPLPKAA